MHTKLIQLALFALWLSSCLLCAEDDEAKLMQHNSDWQITSEVFTNPPYWLMPTNSPFRLYPLSNGKWVWTTNDSARLFETGQIELTIDSDRERQLRQQWQAKQRQLHGVNDPPGIANVEEYRHWTWDQKRIWNTNAAENWGCGVWAEDTNTSWRVSLCPFNNNKTSAIVEAVIVKVGSVVTNSGAGLLPSPDAKYAKLELLDAAGMVVATKPGAAINLYQEKYFTETKDMIVNSHPPSGRDATVERNYPDIISDLEYARWNVPAETYSRFGKGKFMHFAGFVSNGPPCRIGFVRFNDIFAIKTEGEYTLTVQPVLYRMHYEGGTFQGYLDRVDLPSVTTKIRLAPTQ